MKRTVMFITLLAFIFRLGLGLSASVLLPQVGYQSKTQQSGYLFFDAFRRDTQAWDLAQSGKPLSKAFDQKYSSDQYGGLLWVSAVVYRYFGGGVHEPLFVVFLAALIGSLGVIFIFLTAQRLMDYKRALFSAILFAFFPESILLGAAQMREPFLMTFIAMAFYGLVEWQSRRGEKQTGIQGWLPWLWMGLALTGMLFVSPGFVLVTLVACAGWVYFGNKTAAASGRKFPWVALAGAAALFVVALFVVASSWNSLVAAKGSGVFGVIGSWARETAKWNAYTLDRSSGIVQVLFKSLPIGLSMPFVTVYGILQPVLPAAIFEPAIPFWQILGIVRALGWYLLLPLLAFAPFAAWDLSGEPDEAAHRKQWLWVCLVVWGWVLIAAIRGGGDQWDNPRYRIILLPWIAMLTSLAFYRVRASAGRWFWRIFAVETIILLVFGHWYSWRYLGLGFNIGIRNSLVLAIVLSVCAVVGDIFWQRLRPSSRVQPRL